MNYYNENDKRTATWLRELIEAGCIPKGEVDDRSITEVEPSDLAGFTQCHFFAGIGGWSYALRLAAWPDDVPVWTGSCPCQPLSSAGKRKGEMDERHLWPEFYRLIAECRPATVFGEQVASNDGLEWLDGVSLDLEEIGYAVGAADLPAACVGSPHERQRFFWVAHSHLSSEYRWPPSGQQPIRGVRDGRHEAVGHAAGTGPQEQWREYRPSGEGCSGLVGLAMQTDVPEWNGPTIAVKCSDGSRRVSAQPGYVWMADGLLYRMADVRSEFAAKAVMEIVSYAKISRADSQEVMSVVQIAARTQAIQWSLGRQWCIQEAEVLLSLVRNALSAFNRTSNSCSGPQEGQGCHERMLRDLRLLVETECASLRRESQEQFAGQSTDPLSALSQFLARCCKACWRISSGQNAAAFPLAKGVKHRMMALRGYGNAIVPQVAAKFIEAVRGEP